MKINNLGEFPAIDKDSLALLDVEEAALFDESDKPNRSTLVQSQRHPDDLAFESQYLAERLS